MLKVAKVNFNQEVNVACVCYLRQRVVEPLEFLIADHCLKFEVLTCEMTERGMLLRQGESVDESVSG